MLYCEIALLPSYRDAVKAHKSSALVPVGSMTVETGSDGGVAIEDLTLRCVEQNASPQSVSLSEAILDASRLLTSASHHC